MENLIPECATKILRIDELWQIEPRPLSFVRDAKLTKLQQIQAMPRTRERYVDELRIGVHARKDGATAITGDVTMMWHGITPTLSRAIEKMPRSFNLHIFTTVKPLVDMWTGKVRLALPERDASVKVPVKINQWGKSVKGPLPTGNFEQWRLARLLYRHKKVWWYLVEHLPNAEAMLNAQLITSLDEVKEIPV